jgi:hypothetical protein
MMRVKRVKPNLRGIETSLNIFIPEIRMNTYQKKQLVNE